MKVTLATLWVLGVLATHVQSFVSSGGCAIVRQAGSPGIVSNAAFAHPRHRCDDTSTHAIISYVQVKSKTTAVYCFRTTSIEPVHRRAHGVRRITAPGARGVGGGLTFSALLPHDNIARTLFAVDLCISHKAQKAFSFP